MLTTGKVLREINVVEITSVVKCEQKNLTDPVPGVENVDSLVAPAGLNSIALAFPPVLYTPFCVCI